LRQKKTRGGRKKIGWPYFAHLFPYFISFTHHPYLAHARDIAYFNLWSKTVISEAFPKYTSLLLLHVAIAVAIAEQSPS
jgi:hypothetical protein